MTASQLPYRSRDRSGYPPLKHGSALISPVFRIASATLRRTAYQGRSPWLVSRCRLANHAIRTGRRTPRHTNKYKILSRGVGNEDEQIAVIVGDTAL
jgi:hypothetical protein